MPARARARACPRRNSFLCLSFLPPILILAMLLLFFLAFVHLFSASYTRWEATDEGRRAECGSFVSRPFELRPRFCRCDIRTYLFALKRREKERAVQNMPTAENNKLGKKFRGNCVQERSIDAMQAGNATYVLPLQPNCSSQSVISMKAKAGARKVHPDPC